LTLNLGIKPRLIGGLSSSGDRRRTSSDSPLEVGHHREMVGRVDESTGFYLDLLLEGEGRVRPDD
jgi:hypothetical protein